MTKRYDIRPVTRAILGKAYDTLLHCADELAAQREDAKTANAEVDYQDNLDGLYRQIVGMAETLEVLDGLCFDN